MKIIRLKMPYGSNLYRIDGYKIEAFNKDAEARVALGRWSACPNINVAQRIWLEAGAD